MSLLVTGNDPRINEIARRIFDAQLEADPKLNTLYDERQKRLWYQDILYNISYLTTALQLKDNQLFPRYAVWLYELLCSLMKQLDRDAIRNQMVDHYRFLLKEVPLLYSGEEEDLASTYIQTAIDATDEAVTNVVLSDRFLTGKHIKIRLSQTNSISLIIPNAGMTTALYARDTFRC